jgi:Holliday junction resolvasome RuvABC endonuclease subunit
MVTRLLKLTRAPEPADAADGVAAALAHLMAAHIEMMAARANGHSRR